MGVGEILHWATFLVILIQVDGCLLTPNLPAGEAGVEPGSSRPGTRPSSLQFSKSDSDKILVFIILALVKIIM